MSNVIKKLINLFNFEYDNHRYLSKKDIELEKIAFKENIIKERLKEFKRQYSNTKKEKCPKRINKVHYLDPIKLEKHTCQTSVGPGAYTFEYLSLDVKCVFCEFNVLQCSLPKIEGFCENIEEEVNNWCRYLKSEGLISE